MNALQSMMEEMNSSTSGMKVELKRQLPNGATVDASPEQLDSLKMQSSIASIAQILKGMPEDEKNQWALNLKDYANELYRQKMYGEAMSKYIECLTAANFGLSAVVDSDAVGSAASGHSDEVTAATTVTTESTSMADDVAAAAPSSNASSNIGTVVVPCLNNLCACAIQCHQWKKAEAFATEVLKLLVKEEDKQCCSDALAQGHASRMKATALVRRSSARLSLCCYSQALEDAVTAEDMVTQHAENEKKTMTDADIADDSGACRVVTSEEQQQHQSWNVLRGRIILLKMKAQTGIRNEGKAVKRVGHAMKKAFYTTETTTTKADQGATSDEGTEDLYDMTASRASAPVSPSKPKTKTSSTSVASQRKAYPSASKANNNSGALDKTKGSAPVGEKDYQPVKKTARQGLGLDIGMALMIAFVCVLFAAYGMLIVRYISQKQ